jgi:predicted dithiol-disulfide oxidoreductase (DUF899 family)
VRTLSHRPASRSSAGPGKGRDPGTRRDPRATPATADGHDARLHPGGAYDARFVIVTQGPIDEALEYKRRVGNKIPWYSTANSPFGADVGAPPGGGFAVKAFLRDGADVYRTWHTNGRGTEQLSHTFALIDLLPYGRHEDRQDSPEGWPQSPAYRR